MRKLVVGLAALGITACQGADLTAPARGIVAASAAGNASAPKQRAPLRTLDDEFGDFVQEVPGFGGLYLEGANETSPGRLTVVVTNPGAIPDDVVRARVSKLLRRMGRSDLSDLVTAGGVAITRGNYTFAQLKGWYPYATALLARPGVLRTDIDERRNRLVVGVADEARRQEVAEALGRARIPAGAVLIELTPPVQLTATLSDPVRPVVGGLTINDELYQNRCTLGYNHVFGNSRVFVTAAHCTGGHAAIGVVTQMVMHQPRYNGTMANAVGYELSDPPFFDNATDSRCPAGVSRGCRYSDAAAFEYYDHVPTDRNGLPYYIAHVGSGTDSLSTIIGYHQTYGQALTPVVGEIARKIGSQTGYSEGAISTTCSHETSGGASPYVLLCQDIANYRSDHGDSGAPVYLRVFDNKRYIAGVHWGKRDGKAIFSPVSNVHYELFGCVLCGVN
jgi:hypothetical protein